MVDISAYRAAGRTLVVELGTLAEATYDVQDGCGLDQAGDFSDAALEWIDAKANTILDFFGVGSFTSSQAACATAVNNSVGWFTSPYVVGISQKAAVSNNPTLDDVYDLARAIVTTQNIRLALDGFEELVDESKGVQLIVDTIEVTAAEVPNVAAPVAGVGLVVALLAGAVLLR